LRVNHHPNNKTKEIIISLNVPLPGKKEFDNKIFKLYVPIYQFGNA